jgi:hypothetical protein
MKYLKKYHLFLEEDEFDVKETDKEDIKLAKEKLDDLEKQLAEYPSKKAAIDAIYKNSKKIEETDPKIKEILGEESEDRNPFLVEYNIIARISKEVELLHDEIVQDKLKADDFKQEASMLGDNKILKVAINAKISDVNNRIADKNKKIVEKQKEIQELSTEHNEKMGKMKEDMQEYIKKISEPEEK